jgi:hypothetical protein
MTDDLIWLRRLQFVLAIQSADFGQNAVPKHFLDIRAIEFCDVLRDSAQWAVLEATGQVRTKFSIREAKEVEVEASKIVDCFADAWKLNLAHLLSLLGLESEKELNVMRTQDVSKLGEQIIERITALVEIFGAINILLPVPDRADEWIRAPNRAPLFEGQSALELMTAGGVKSIHAVRGYLYAELVGP